MITLLQLSGSLFRNEAERAYRSKLERIGVDSPSDYMELPRWQALATAYADQQGTPVRSVCCKSAADVFRLWNWTPAGDELWCSLLDRHMPVWQEAFEMIRAGMSLLPGEYPLWRAGGYVDHTQIKVRPPHFTWYDRVLGDGSSSYRLFEGVSCLPRIRLSSGCPYNCKFCTADKGPVAEPLHKVLAEALSFQPLRFRYVYCDDRTYGAAPETEYLAEGAYKAIRSYNPGFEGFIVQSSPRIMRSDVEMDKAVNGGVRYIELGMESVNDRTLEWMGKPHRHTDTSAAFGAAAAWRIPLIPYILLGVPGDDPIPTVEYLEQHREQIAYVQVAHLSVYEGNHGLPLTAKTEGDRCDQPDATKSWLTENEILRNRAAEKRLLAL